MASAVSACRRATTARVVSASVGDIRELADFHAPAITTVAIRAVSGQARVQTLAKLRKVLHKPLNSTDKIHLRQLSLHEVLFPHDALAVV